MNKILIRNKKEPKIGFPVGVIMKRQETKGDVGIEIEVEGKKLLHEAPTFISNNPISKWWTYHKDHSLRGEENAEYVLRHPILFGEVDTALDALWTGLRANGAKIDDSNRTSVHVHLNVQKFHLNRLTSFFALYFCVEEILTQWCGDHRVGNLFCLRAKDAPAIISQIRRYIRTDGGSSLHDNLHYSGMNVHALGKFGSVEIRTLRGVAEPEVASQWVRLLRRIYDISADYPDPREICALFSAEGPLAFFDHVLGAESHNVKKYIGWSDDDVRDSMMEGIRMAQDLCFCRDWSVFKPMAIKNDPFGRDIRKVMKGLQTSAAEVPASVLPGWAGPDSLPSALPPTILQWVSDQHAPPPSPLTQWVNTLPAHNEFEDEDYDEGN